MDLLLKDVINIGQKAIQKGGRVAFSDVLNANGLSEGDMVEVYLKKVR